MRGGALEKLFLWPYLNPLSHMSTLNKPGEEEERHNMPRRAKFLKTKCMECYSLCKHEI